MREAWFDREITVTCEKLMLPQRIGRKRDWANQSEEELIVVQAPSPRGGRSGQRLELRPADAIALAREIILIAEQKQEALP